MQSSAGHSRALWMGLRVLAFVSFALAWGFGCQAWLGGLRAVIPGEIYRSRQPTPAELDAAIARLRLRSVVNLRYSDETKPWYHLDHQVTDAHGIALYGLQLTASQLPTPQQLVALIDLLESAERPMLMHCRHGVDRTGLASALVDLLEGASPARAARQFVPVYRGLVGDVGSPLPLVVEQYADHLARAGVEHTPARLRLWAQRDYAPLYYRARWTLEAEPRLDEPEPLLRVRLHNASGSAIPLRTGGRGVRLQVGSSPRDRHIPWELSYLSRRDLGDESLAPGESIDVSVPLPPFPQPGRYRIVLDLFDEVRRLSFQRMGSPPFVFEVEVPGAAPESSFGTASEEALPDPSAFVAPDFELADSFACPTGTVRTEGEDWLGWGRWCERRSGGKTLREGPAWFRWPSGHRRAEGQFRNGLAEGRWLVAGEFATDGWLHRFRSGMLDGTSLQWTRHGELSFVNQWRAGARHGIHLRYLDGRTLLERGHYVEGAREGEWTFWYPDGTMARTGRFHGGVEVGAWKAWSANGVEISSSESPGDRARAPKHSSPG